MTKANKLASQIKALLDHASPGPWKAINLDGDRFPSLRVGAPLPYSDNSGIGEHRIVFNEGPSPEATRRGVWSNQMASCQANAKLVALLINNLPAILKRLEE